jgi:hypothetical protein
LKKEDKGVIVSLVIFVKKILLILFCVCLAFVPSTFGEDSLDGYGWEIWPEDAKRIYLEGFLHGYVTERTHMNVFGYSDTHDDLFKVGSTKFVSEKEMDTLTQQLGKTTAAQEVLVQEIEALKGEIAKKNGELSNVHSQIISLKESLKRYKKGIAALQDEKEMEKGKRQAWEERYGELDARLKDLVQRAAALTEELETARLVKTEIEKQLRNEDKLRRATLERIAQSERDVTDKADLLATSEKAGGTDDYVTGVPRWEKGKSEWWGHDSQFYLKELDSFYQTYPLCKIRKFNTVLRDTINIWGKQSGTQQSRIYKKIGETCNK